jgi:hypothetical protein
VTLNIIARDTARHQQLRKDVAIERSGIAIYRHIAAAPLPRLA